MCTLFFEMIRETAFAGKGEKKNVCNEKWKRKLFAMKRKRTKCERTKCLQRKGKEQIVHIERGDNKMFKMERERIKSHNEKIKNRTYMFT